MASNSLTAIPDWDGTTENWLAFSERFIRLMVVAGVDLVCRPNFVTEAKSVGWTSSSIVEARIFVWQRMDDGMSKHQAARNALKLAGPEYDGETC